jgi:peptide deformylase
MKSMKILVKKIYCIAGILLLFIACNSLSTTFTVEEVELINKYSEQVMPVLQTSNVSDSLFLRQATKEFSAADLQSDLFKSLQQQMLLTVNDTLHLGVGIAAPQVGIARRLIAVQRFDKPDKQFEFYTNAYIVYYSDKKRTGTEGCLSVPNCRGKVERSETIVVKYIDVETLKPCTDTVSGFTAVIFQHEIDHLDGVLYIDRLDRD